MERNGKVYLVGAGCGAEDMITVRGKELLAACDAVVYDDLVAPGLLQGLKPSAEIVYMGKRGGRPSSRQEEINEKLIALAQEGKMVVRLKGGDPFVFGRGGEELLALQEAGIAFEEVPGISSCIAIPAEHGIPVTHRGVSRSFHVITAHTAEDNGMPEQMALYAKLDGTLVFLMGLGRLALLAETLIAGGKDPETPAAVVSGGNAKRSVCVRATLSTIASEAAAAKVDSPAVIVVGETAALSFADPQKQALRGVSVGLTGTDTMLRAWQAQLAPYGAQTFAAVRGEVVTLPVSFAEVLDRKDVWIVFTSGHGVTSFFTQLKEQGLDIRRLAGCKFAVIGAATGKKLQEYGIIADVCPDVYTGEALAAALRKAGKPGEKMMLFRSAQGSPELFAALSEQFETTDYAVYTVKYCEEATNEEKDRAEHADYLTFASAGGVEAFLRKYGKIPETAVCVAIGPVTERALRERTNASVWRAEGISSGDVVKMIVKNERM